jgi:PAS domain S-box-containing protein
VTEAERVRASEERFRLASEAVQGVIYDLDARTGRFWASEGMGRIVGVPAPGSTFTRNWWQERIHPDDRLLLAADMERLADSPDTRWSRRYRVRHEDGHWVHVWDSARLLRDADGRIVRVLGYSMDISAEVEAEAAMRASEERLRLATDVVRGLVYDVDFRTGRVWRSDGMHTLLGVEPDAGEPTWEWWLERIHPDDAARVGRIVEDLRAGLFEAEYRVRHADGHYVRVWDRMRVLQGADGRLRRAVGYTMDVSALYDAEAARRASELRLQLAVEALGLASWDFDLAGGSLTWSESHYALFGCDPVRDGPPSMAMWRRRVHPDDLPRVAEAVSQSMTTGAPYACSYRIRRADTGEERVLLARGRTLRGADDRLEHFVGVVFDVTEQASAQEALRRRAEEMEGLLSVLPAAVWYAHDPDCRVVTGNAFAARLTPPVQDGNVSAALPDTNRPWRVLAPEGSPLGIDDMPLQRAVATREPVEGVELSVRGPDGTQTPLLGGAVPLFDERGEVRGAVAAFMDITGRKRAERELHEARLLFERIADTTPGILYLYDLVDQRNVYASAGIAGTLGYTAAEVQAMDGDLGRQLIHPDDLGAPVTALDDAPGTVREHHLRMRHADGRYRLLRCRETIFSRDDDGRPRLMLGIAHDVTEERATAEALRASEGRLRLALLAARAMVFEWDIAADHVVPMGLLPNEVETPARLSIDEALRTVHPDDVGAVRLRIQQALAGESSDYLSEHRLLTPPDAEPCWVLVRGHVARDEDGRPRRMTGVVVDVTTRRMAEEALRESEQRLRELADAMPQIVFVNRADGSIEFVNRQWEVNTGASWTSDEAVHSAVHPDDREGMLAAWEATRDGGDVYVSEFRLRMADGSFRWFLSRAVPIRDASGIVRRWYGTSTDIDAQRRALAALQHGEARQRALADAALRINASLSMAQPLAATLQLVADLAREILAAHQGLLLASRHGPDGGVLHAASFSDRYAEWRNYDEPVTGRGIYSVVCRANRPMRLSQAELEAHPAYTRFRDAQRPHPPLRGWLAVPLVDRDGRNLGVLQFSDRADGGDFTAEDEAVATQLAAMAAVAIENWQLVQQIREADRRKDEFLATLAHELRNPLAPIGNSIELLRRAAGDPDAVGRARDTMERQMGHLVHLVDDLLDASRITSGKLTLRRERVALVTVLLQGVETARPALERAGLTLDLHLPAEPAWLDADATRLTQVFSNLLHNAAKFGGQGVVTVQAAVTGGEVVVQVQDQGVGIPSDKLADIFEMFSQVDRSPDRGTGGLGIGLALVRRLVEMHGGRAEAASAGEGMGSTFTVRLPTVPAPDGVGAAAPAPVGRSGARRILVADDNRDSADSMAALLGIAGHETAVVYDGPEAVAAATRLRPDVVLLDLGMPRMDGHEAALRIRECLGPGVLLVAMTGWGDEQSRLRSRESGFDAHLTKPVDLPRLLALLSPQ